MSESPTSIPILSRPFYDILKSVKNNCDDKHSIDSRMGSSKRDELFRNSGPIIFGPQEFSVNGFR